MSANKAALLHSATERAILEHDKALKGLKVKQFVSRDALVLHELKLPDDALHSLDGVFAFTLDAGGFYIYTASLSAAPGVQGLILPFFDVYIDNDENEDYLWPNGDSVRSGAARQMTAGFKYSIKGDSDTDMSQESGYIPFTLWIHNDDSVPHTVYIKIRLLTNFRINEESLQTSRMWWE